MKNHMKPKTTMIIRLISLSLVIAKHPLSLLKSPRQVKSKSFCETGPIVSFNSLPRCLKLLNVRIDCKTGITVFKNNVN